MRPPPSTRRVVVRKIEGHGPVLGKERAQGTATAPRVPSTARAQGCTKSVDAMLEDVLRETEGESEASRCEAISFPKLVVAPTPLAPSEAPSNAVEPQAGEMRAVLPSADAVVVDTEPAQRARGQRAPRVLVYLSAAMVLFAGGISGWQLTHAPRASSAPGKLATSAAPVAVAAPTEPVPSPSPVATSPPAVTQDAEPTKGVLKFASRGRRIFVDGRLVGEGPIPVSLSCGPHKVKVGNSGRPRSIDVPCGAELDVLDR